MKSIPVVQQVYQSILADLTANFNVLLKSLQQKPIQIGNASTLLSQLSEDNAEAALIFDCSALCLLGNVKGNLITVSFSFFVKKTSTTGFVKLEQIWAN